MTARAPSAVGAVFVAAASAAALAFVSFIAVLGGATGAQNAALTVSLAGLVSQAAQACVVAGPVAGLDATQAGYADQIVSAAFAASAENQVVARIALMVAYTESSLRNLGPQSGNADSLGLFQQRASQGWGTPAEEGNPATATGMFVQRLLAVRGWSGLPPWVAAQKVQRSAFDGHPSAANNGSSAVGGNYQTNWDIAGQLLGAVLANGNAPGSCGQGIPGATAGPPSAFGLPPGYAMPVGTGPAHALVVQFALAQLGKPYVWAAAGPDSYDCSGLTMAAWAAVGVHLAHYTVDQQRVGQPVAVDRLMAGDLALIPGSDSPGPGLAGHVGIYIGAGLVLSAIDPQKGVAVQPWQTFVSGGLIALRDPDPLDG